MNELSNVLVLKFEYRGGVSGNLWKLENLFNTEKKRLYTDYGTVKQYEKVINFIDNLQGVKNINIITTCRDYYLILCELDLLQTNFSIVSDKIKNYKF